MAEQPRLVLHVDDDPQMLRIVAKQLGDAGYEVVSLSNPDEVQATLLNSDCRVVLLDIDMTPVSGLELLSDIKRHDGAIQVIMLTGLVSMTTVLESMRRGAEACFFKPISDFEALLDVLEAAFVKRDRWWNALRDLADRRKQSLLPAESVH